MEGPALPPRLITPSAFECEAAARVFRVLSGKDGALPIGRTPNSNGKASRPEDIPDEALMTECVVGRRTRVLDGPAWCWCSLLPKDDGGPVRYSTWALEGVGGMKVKPFIIESAREVEETNEEVDSRGKWRDPEAVGGALVRSRLLTSGLSAEVCDSSKACCAGLGRRDSGNGAEVGLRGLKCACMFGDFISEKGSLRVDEVGEPGVGRGGTGPSSMSRAVNPPPASGLRTLVRDRRLVPDGVDCEGTGTTSARMTPRTCLPTLALVTIVGLSYRTELEEEMTEDAVEKPDRTESA